MRDLPPPSDRVATAVAGLLTLIWGTTWAGVRFSLEGYPPLLGVSLRFALAAVVLFGLAAAWGISMRPDRRIVALWLIQASCAFGISYGLVYWAEQWVPSGLVAVLFATLPLFVTLFAYFLLPAERLDSLGWLGMLCGFGGVALIFSEDLNALGGPQVRFAAACVLLAPLAAGFAQVAVKRWGQGVESLVLVAPPMLLSACGMGALSRIFEAERQVSAGLIPTLAVLYLALLGSALTFTLFFWLLQHVSAIRVSLIAYGTPVIAVCIGTLFLSEPLTWRMVVGAALVIGGVAFVATPRRKRAAATT
ncbi:MAG: EamA family transporter [Acidobacteriota bacterium]